MLGLSTLLSFIPDGLSQNGASPRMVPHSLRVGLPTPVNVFRKVDMCAQCFAS